MTSSCFGKTVFSPKHKIKLRIMNIHGTKYSNMKKTLFSKLRNIMGITDKKSVGADIGIVSHEKFSCLKIKVLN